MPVAGKLSVVKEGMFINFLLKAIYRGPRKISAIREFRDEFPFSKTSTFVGKDSFVRTEPYVWTRCRIKGIFLSSGVEKQLAH